MPQTSPHRPAAFNPLAALWKRDLYRLFLATLDKTALSIQLAPTYYHDCAPQALDICLALGFFPQKSAHIGHDKWPGIPCGE